MSVIDTNSLVGTNQRNYSAKDIILLDILYTCHQIIDMEENDPTKTQVASNRTFNALIHPPLR